MRILAMIAAAALAVPAAAQTPEQWIDWGSRVHGGFGVLIAVGIRIGQDAQQRLGAQRREVDVTYFDSPLAPCPCIADGLIVALSASPGQRTLRIAPEPAAAGLYGEVLLRHRKTGAQLRYCIRPEAMAALDQIQSRRDFRFRYDAVMAKPAAELFTVSPQPDRCPG